jgi:hypothetical protein
MILLLVGRTPWELLSGPQHHRRAAPADLHVLNGFVTPSELRVRRLTPHRLGRALRSPTAGSDGSGCKPGDASLLDFIDKTVIEPVQDFLR